MALDPTTNLLNSPENATITVRVIKSFAYRTVKPLVLRNLNLLETTVEALKATVRNEIATKPAWKAYRNVELDTVKLYTVAHGHKTTNLIINLEEDPHLMLNDDKRNLASYGIENETELSIYNKAQYDEYVLDPEMKW